MPAFEAGKQGNVGEIAELESLFQTLSTVSLRGLSQGGDLPQKDALKQALQGYTEQVNVLPEIMLHSLAPDQRAFAVQTVSGHCLEVSFNNLGFRFSLVRDNGTEMSLCEHMTGELTRELTPEAKGIIARVSGQSDPKLASDLSFIASQQRSECRDIALKLEYIRGIAFLCQALQKGKVVDLTELKAKRTFRDRAAEAGGNALRTSLRTSKRGVKHLGRALPYLAGAALLAYGANEVVDIGPRKAVDDAMAFAGQKVDRVLVTPFTDEDYHQAKKRLAKDEVLIRTPGYDRVLLDKYEYQPANQLALVELIQTISLADFMKFIHNPRVQAAAVQKLKFYPAEESFTDLLKVVKTDEVRQAIVSRLLGSKGPPDLITKIVVQLTLSPDEMRSLLQNAPKLSIGVMKALHDPATKALAIEKLEPVPAVFVLLNIEDDEMLGNVVKILALKKGVLDSIMAHTIPSHSRLQKVIIRESSILSFTSLVIFNEDVQITAVQKFGKQWLYDSMITKYREYPRIGTEADAAYKDRITIIARKFLQSQTNFPHVKLLFNSIQ